MKTPRFLACLCLALLPKMTLATELRAAVFVQPGSTWSLPFERWIEKVNERGHVTIRLAGPEVISMPDQPQAIQAGTLDIVALPPGVYKNLLPEANAQELSNLSLTEQRQSGGYEAINQLLRTHLNAFAISTYGQGVPFHIYLNQPIHEFRELAGLHIRAQPLHIPLMQSLGLNVVISDLPELTAALERNIVQAYAYSLVGIDNFGWQHHTAQRIDPGFYASVVNILVNQDTWQTLSRDEQDSLLEASDWLETDTPARLKHEAQQAYRLQAEAGIEVFQAPPEFAAQARAIYWQQLEQKSPLTTAKLKRLLIR